MIRTYTLTTNDAEQWRQVVPLSLSVTHSLEYVRLSERQSGQTARLFVVERGHPVAAYPYFLRPVQELTIAEGIRHVGFDTCTPEYAGPMWLNGGFPPHSDAPRFSELFAAHCREQGIIAEFAHLNPWIAAELLETDCTHPDREIVYVDLTGTEDQVWTRSLTSDNRRQIKQGLRAGVSVRRATSSEDVGEFYRLYTHTMERRKALDRYFFPREYFLEFFEHMPANSSFILAEHQGQVVAGGLFYWDNETIYWHLSAADREWSQVRPVNVYLFDTIRQSLGQSWKRMVLGGAYTAGDGVFYFKSCFSPLRARFSTYRRVHDASTYTALTQAWRAQNGGAESNPSFFPLYRSVPAEPAACAAV